MKLPICDITPFTLQDFPGFTACILWFGGCNMRCSYCHNPELVLGKKQRLNWQDVMQFLVERVDLLDGVVLSGGECTLSPTLPQFIRQLHNLGYKVKLDTNGLTPNMLTQLIADNLLDYVALDYKAPEYNFLDIVGQGEFSAFNQSLEILCNANIAFEIRTTVHSALLDEQDIAAIMQHLQQLGFTGDYYLQNFQPSPETIKPLPEHLNKLDVDKLPSDMGFTLCKRNF